ncbi:hypothetical protein BU26DRAFT_556394 [Trematosphaeria pertusa]|uniref:Uncharacterized protein n=1 Tax=Trematosphaeria pertusa TaxID=390896 RepID=A0A6A6HRW7_9PLEO|nr:uncharacterized protein BU26DRAFT_556394 [Trematosphaeria pertusa]KAF2240904.1 hypothetical protein BU26DRAFT_556394 [Trematosphaeria pertusa]
MPDKSAAPDAQPLFGVLANVVETHGKHLLPRPSTPVHSANAQFDAVFYEALCHRLRWLQEVFPLRERIYAAHAANSRPGHTPPTLRAQHQSAAHNTIRDFIQHMSPPTPGTPVASPTRVMSPPRTPTPCSTVLATPPGVAAPLRALPRRSETRPSYIAKKRKLESEDRTVGPVPKQRHSQHIGKAIEAKEALGYL